MKTITLQEALNQATPGPLAVEPQPNGCTWSLWSGDSEVAEANSELDAALLAHSFNTLPKVVECLREVVAGYESANSGGIMRMPDGSPSQLAKLWIARSKAALAEAETVQVPE